MVCNFCSSSSCLVVAFLLLQVTLGKSTSHVPKNANTEESVIDMSIIGLVWDFTPRHKPVSRDNGRLAGVEVIAWSVYELRLETL